MWHCVVRYMFTDFSKKHTASIFRIEDKEATSKKHTESWELFASCVLPLAHYLISICLVLKMKAVLSFETSVNFYRTTRNPIPEDSILISDLCEYFESNIVMCQPSVLPASFGTFMTTYSWENQIFSRTNRFCVIILWHRALAVKWLLKSSSFWAVDLWSRVKVRSKFDFQRTTRRCIPEDRTLHNHRCENLIRLKVIFLHKQVPGLERPSYLPHLDPGSDWSLLGSETMLYFKWTPTFRRKILNAEAECFCETFVSTYCTKCCHSWEDYNLKLQTSASTVIPKKSGVGIFRELCLIGEQSRDIVWERYVPRLRGRGFV
jgi:hypothetical protein